MERHHFAGRFGHRRLAIAALTVVLAAQAFAATDRAATPVMVRPAAFKERIADRALIEQLRKGGFVLYVSDEGLGAGEAIRAGRIPVAEVFHSPRRPVREVAQQAFRNTAIPLVEASGLRDPVVLPPDEKASVAAAARRVLSVPAPDGANRVVFAEAAHLANLLGYFIRPPGTIVVIRPLGLEEGFEYVGSVPPALWPAMSN